MLRFLFAFIILIHGLIHLMGFAKAFGYGNITQLTKEISKPAGMLWLAAAIVCIATAVLIVFQKNWWLIGIAAAVLSQALIIGAWADAKFGTVANIILLLGAILSFGSWRFEQQYQKDVQEGLARTRDLEAALLTEQDIRHLPEPVQRYLRYTGALNKPKVHSVRIVFEGEMRDRGKDWFAFRSEQYNFFDRPTRLFFMKARMFGLTVPGYHAYKNGDASMQIKLFGLIPVVNLHGGVLNKAETVTIFNDICLLAPAALIDPAIQWQAVDSVSAQATYTVAGNTITATLFFNEAGQLVDFRSDDRTAISDMKQYPFTTPVRDYWNVDGRQVVHYGEAVWHYPDEVFTYGKFNLKEIEYNGKNRGTRCW